MKPITNAWALREVYFDENGDPIMHREPERKPLTDEEIKSIVEKCGIDTQFIAHTSALIARAIEAAHGIKE
jgi:arsenate reductase-like glutaredoxin family protein